MFSEPLMYHIVRPECKLRLREDKAKLGFTYIATYYVIGQSISKEGMGTYPLIGFFFPF